jgi:hypothetical protein
MPENQGPNRERKAGRWGESMVRRGGLERCETGASPLETREKRKPVTPENDPRETGLSFLNGGVASNEKITQPSDNKGYSCFRYFNIPPFVPPVCKGEVYFGLNDNGRCGQSAP